jgi:hypothetical protein
MNHKTIIIVFTTIAIIFVSFILVTAIKSTGPEYHNALIKEAHQWCFDMKLNCDAINCPDDHEFSICDVKYGNNLVSLNCGGGFCSIRELKK